MCAFFAKLLSVPTEPKICKFNDPIFLIGLIRSGTTLLLNTLSEHPQLLKVGFELNKMWTVIGGAPCSSNCVERLASDHEIDFQNNVTAYYAKYMEKSKSALRHLSRWSQKRHYGSGRIFYDWEDIYLMNKSPHLSNKISYLNAMYPRSKFIVIVRSPYGQSASQKIHFLSNHKKKKIYFYLPDDDTSCWSKIKVDAEANFDNNRIFPNNFSMIPEAWLRLNTTIFKHLDDVDENRKVVIAYEDLIVERASSLNRIFNMLDLKKEHQHKVQRIIKKERKIHNTNTMGNPLQKWKKHLNEEEQKGVNDMLLSNKNEYEYIKSCVPNSSKYWKQ